MASLVKVKWNLPKSWNCRIFEKRTISWETSEIMGGKSKGTIIPDKKSVLKFRYTSQGCPLFLKLFRTMLSHSTNFRKFKPEFFIKLRAPLGWEPVSAWGWISFPEPFAGQGNESSFLASFWEVEQGWWETRGKNKKFFFLIICRPLFSSVVSSPHCIFTIEISQNLKRIICRS